MYGTDIYEYKLNFLICCRRLASSLMSQKQAEQPVATPEIQSSIKEVTSAIVHYVNDQTNRGSRSRSFSPSTRLVRGSFFTTTSYEVQ